MYYYPIHDQCNSYIGLENITSAVRSRTLGMKPGNEFRRSPARRERTRSSEYNYLFLRRLGMAALDKLFRVCQHP